MLKVKFIILLFAALSLTSCSKDDSVEDTENEEDVDLQNCEIEDPDLGCAEVYLKGNETGWTRILKQGELADPLFLYPSGDTSDPYGTVTVSLVNGAPEIRMNDLLLDDYVIYISQDSDGSDAICKAEENLTPPASDDESDALIRMTGNYSFPFYIKIKANVCF